MENNKLANRKYLFDTTKLAVVYHPGDTLEEKLSEMGMSIKEFALNASLPQNIVAAVIKGERSVTPEMASSFEMVTKIPAHMWLRHQELYDEYIARKRRGSTRTITLETPVRKTTLSTYIRI